MTASGAFCLPPSLLSTVCGGTVEGKRSKHQQQISPSAATRLITSTTVLVLTCNDVLVHACRFACVVPAQNVFVQVTVLGSTLCL